MSRQEELLELQALATVRLYDVMLVSLHATNPEVAKQLEAKHAKGELAVESPWEVQNDLQTEASDNDNAASSATDSD